MRVITLDPLLQDAVMRFVRECQLTAAAFIPPGNPTEIVTRVHAAVRAFPGECGDSPGRAVAKTLIALAGQVVAWSRHSHGEHTLEESAADRAVRKLAKLHTDPTVSLEMISAAALVSKCHLSRELRSRTRLGFYEMVSLFRTLTSIHFLRDEKLPIHQVARLAGYCGTAGLDRHLRFWIALTPTELRRIAGATSDPVV